MKDLAKYDVFDNLADLESWFSIFLSQKRKLLYGFKVVLSNLFEM